jgi:hypothetical protein
MVGGAWPGHHQATISFSRFMVTTTDGTIAFHDGLPSGYLQSGMNGVQLRFLGTCTPAASYCTAKPNSLGCVPSIGSSGSASLSSTSPFLVTASNVLNHKNGLLYYGFSAASAPFQGGVHCVSAPTRRTAVQDSGGNGSGDDCSGSYSFDFNALIDSAVDANLVQGAVVFCQYWSRDPASPSTTGLTDGLVFTICP